MEWQGRTINTTPHSSTLKTTSLTGYGSQHGLSLGNGNSDVVTLPNTNSMGDVSRVFNKVSSSSDVALLRPSISRFINPSLHLAIRIQYPENVYDGVRRQKKMRRCGSYTKVMSFAARMFHGELALGGTQLLTIHV